MFENKLNEYKKMAEGRLLEYFTEKDLPYGSLLEAMKYSLMIGGKRIRPAIMLEFYRVCGGSDDILDFAAAIEMIHTYSLIHDDLPCMDDDDMRRGQPSCHVKFGESTALLAGDALLTMAFSAAASVPVPAERVKKAISVLSSAAGAHGMVGGQVMDLDFEGKCVELSQLSKMYSLKTGALIRAAASIGCILAGAEDKYISAADIYAAKIGAAFQIIDDILDVIGDASLLGKPVGSDKRSEKSTFVSLLGIEEAKRRALELTEEAKRAVSIFPDNAFLCELADFLTVRNH